MSDETIIDLLAQSADRVPDSTPPLADVLHQGRQVRRRRLGTAAVASLAAAVLVAGLAVLGVRGIGRGATPAGPPAPPAGMKWVGSDRTVFAVPKSWPVRPGLYCGSPDGHNYVTVVLWGVSAGCAPFRDPAGEPRGDVVLLAVERSGRARLEDTASNWTFGYLPSDWLAVPVGLPSAGAGELVAADEARALRRAGLRVVTVQLPAWGAHPAAVTTLPEMGTPIRVGGTVVVQEHLVSLADSGLSGRLLSVGGPAPGTPRPRAGTVHVTGNGYDEYISTRADGSWHVALPPGVYSAAATPLGDQSGAGTTDACPAVGPVTVKPHRVAEDDVYCQMK